MARGENTNLADIVQYEVAHVDNKHVPVMFFFHLPPHKSNIKPVDKQSKSLSMMIPPPPPSIFVSLFKLNVTKFCGQMYNVNFNVEFIT